MNSPGIASGSVGVTGSGTSTRTVTISSISGTGTLGISIASGTASDTAGNTASAAGPSAAFTVNQPPSISGTSAGQTVHDNATIPPFSGVTIGDTDSPAETLSVSVTIDDATKGSFTTLNGFTDAGGGVYTFSGTAVNATTAIQGLVFTPTANHVATGSPETSTFTISVNDGVNSVFTDSLTTVISQSVNNIPTFTKGANQLVQTNEGAVTVNGWATDSTHPRGC